MDITRTSGDVGTLLHIIIVVLNDCPGEWISVKIKKWRIITKEILTKVTKILPGTHLGREAPKK